MKYQLSAMNKRIELNTKESITAIILKAHSLEFLIKTFIERKAKAYKHLDQFSFIISDKDKMFYGYVEWIERGNVFVVALKRKKEYQIYSFKGDFLEKGSLREHAQGN